MTDTTINSLADLNRLRTAPDLDAAQSQTLREELDQAMQAADWFTVGVMAPSQELALSGHSADPSRFTPTWGPFPLTFF